jgi:hypothetical protein
MPCFVKPAYPGRRTTGERQHEQNGKSHPEYIYGTSDSTTAHMMCELKMMH